MNPIREHDLEQALRSRRPDPEAFRRAVERKLAEREARSGAYGRAAGVLPLPAVDLLDAGLPGGLPGGVAVALLGKKLGATGGLLGWLALPAVSVAMVGLGFVAALRSIVRAQRDQPRGTDEAPVPTAGELVRDWWREHRLRAAAVMALLLAAGRVWPLPVALLLMAGSMVAVTLLVQRLAARGQVRRRTVGDFCANLLGALLGLALVFGDSTGLGGLPGQPGYWAPTLLFVGSFACDVLGRGRGPKRLLWIALPVLLIGGWAVHVGRTARTLDAQRVVAFLERSHPAPDDVIHWQALGCMGEWAAEQGLEVDRGRIVAAVEASLPGEPFEGVSGPFAQSGAARAGGLSEARWRALAKEPETVALLEHAGPFVAPGLVDARVRALVRAGLDAGEREHLAARLRISWPPPVGEPRLSSLERLLAQAELLGEPLEAERAGWVARALEAHAVAGHGAFSELPGQFGPDGIERRKERLQLESTHAAVRLMRRLGVDAVPRDADIDLAATARYLERLATPSLIEASSPRWLGALTIQGYRYHAAVAHAELRALLAGSAVEEALAREDRAGRLGVLRLALVAAALVALCLFATLRSPEAQRERSS